MSRKNELSLLNIIFCLLVIFIHVASAPVTNLDKGSLQYAAIFVPWRLSAFVVQGFIFLSGLKMFLGARKRVDYKKYYVKRARKIVIPYVFAVILFYAYFLRRQYYEFSIKELLGYIVKGDLVSHFYFVVIIVQFYLLRPLWESMLERVQPKLAVILSIPVMLLCKYLFRNFAYNDRVFTTYLFYWMCGCYAGAEYERFVVWIDKHRGYLAAGFFAAAIIEAVASYAQFTGGGVPFIEELHFIYCVAAIAFAAALSLMLKEKIMGIELFKKIDGVSYYIYLIHPIFIFISDQYFENVGISDIGSEFLIRTAITYVGAISVCIAYSEIKKKLIKNRGK